MRGKIIGVCLICTMALCCMVACDDAQSKDEKPTTTAQETTVENQTADKIVAIQVGEEDVYLDEVRYYAYSTQGTYEASYLTMGEEINWDGLMSGDATWEQGVKSMVLDDICKRECFYSMADEYDVTLTKKEEKQIKSDVKTYYKDSNEKLMKKIDIGEESLARLFEKAAIAKKVESKAPENAYDNWKKGHNITTTKEWDKITFDQHIFTLEDLQ